MPTSRQDVSFSDMLKSEIEETIISKTALDSSIEWIKNELTPDAVFDKDQLESWAENNGYIKQ